MQLAPQEHNDVRTSHNGQDRIYCGAPENKVKERNLSFGGKKKCIGDYFQRRMSPRSALREELIEDKQQRLIDVFLMFCGALRRKTYEAVIHTLLQQFHSLLCQDF